MGSQLPPPLKGHSPQFSAHVCCGKTTGWIKMPLGTQVGLGPVHIVLDGDPAPPSKKGAQPPIFGSCLLWSNGRPSQLLQSTCSSCCGSESASGPVGSPRTVACGDGQVVPCLITGRQATVANREPAAHDNGPQHHQSLSKTPVNRHLLTHDNAQLNPLNSHFPF